MFTLQVGVLGGFGLGIGLALTVLFGLEIVILYYLTWEFLRRENSLVYGGLVFTAIWTVLFGVYSDQIIALGIDANILFIIIVAFAAVSAVLAIAPFVIYATKASSYGTMRKQYNTFKQQYEERDQAGNLRGNIGLVNKYDEIKKGINQVEGELKNTDQAFNSIKEKYDLARKSPELVFSPLGNDVETKKASYLPNINYVVVGIGGTGIDYTTSLIDYLNSAGAFVKGEINPYAFFAYDTDVRQLRPLSKRYENQPHIAELIHCKPQLNDKFTESNLLLSNRWLSGEPVSIMNGTGTRRGVGAAAYNVIGEDLVDFMIQEIEHLRQRSAQSSWVVIVLNSLGGGTGSGSFIRLTMDLRKKMHDRLNINNPLVLWFGIVPKNSEGDLYKLNAYAAIKELQFLFERSERRLGQMDEATTIRNPFDACFLLSRESPNQKRDEELKDALVHFISEIGFVPSGHIQDVRLDINDIRTRLGIAANSFGTLNYYQIYFPASILSWYRNYAKPVLQNNTELLDGATKKADTLLSNAETAEIDASGYVQSVDKFITEILMPFKQLRAYKKWITEVQTWNDKLNGFVASLKNEFNFEELKSNANSIRQTNIFKVQQNCDNTNALVEVEKKKLINPDISGIYKQVPVEDPDTFDLSQLTDPKATLRSMIEKSDNMELLQNYLKPLTNPLGDVEMPLAILDFAQMKNPINLGQSGLEFVQAYQPRLIGKDKYSRDTIVVSPKIKSIILLASSCTENLQSPFPTSEQIRGNLSSSAEEEGNAEVSFNKVPAKRFTISVYWLLAGLYIWRLRPKELPVLRDLSFLSEAYEHSATGRRQDMLELFKNHTLFYNDTASLEKLIGIAPRGDITVKRDWVTEFWANYDPSSVAVGTWGTILLATIYDTAEAFTENLLDFERLIKGTENIEDVSELDFSNLRNTYDKLNNSLNQSLLPNLAVLAEYYRILEKGKEDSREVAEGLSKVVEQLAEIQDGCSGFLNKVDNYKKHLSALKSEDLLSKRNQSQVVLMLDNSQKTLKALSARVRNVVTGKGLIVP